MNAALTYLHENRLGLDRYGLNGRLSTVLVTPRFRASRHVIFLVLAASRGEPVLVIKVPRLAGDPRGIQREAANLRAARALRTGGFDSIPRVMACEPYGDRWMLVETALGGRPMDPSLVRRKLAACCHAVLDWLAGVQPPDRAMAADDEDWLPRLIERPLRRFEEVFPVSAEEARMLRTTREVVSTLHGVNFPLVFEHGDLSHPNVLVRRDGRAGVIDWELAEPHGLPVQDLFFFLTYAAFAAGKARRDGRHVPAFHAAFFGQNAWARRYVLAYARRLQLPLEALTPLLVACWARRVTGLLDRLGDADRAGKTLAPDTAAWLRANRYYLLWQHTLTHRHELNWTNLPEADSGSNQIG